MVQDAIAADQTPSSEAAPLPDSSTPTAAAAQAESVEEAENATRSSSRTLERRVTFSDNHMVHHMAGYPSSSSGWEGEAAEAETIKAEGCWAGFKQRVKALKRDILALYYAVHDPRTPILSKLLPWLVLAYALSPLDLIPDFIPVLGLLDDMLLLPLGLWLSYKLIPEEVLDECRYRASHEPLLLERNWLVAVLVFCIWTSGLLVLAHWLIVTYGSDDLQSYKWAVLAGGGGVAAIMFSLWLVSRLRHEARRRDEWNACLLANEV